MSEGERKGAIVAIVVAVVVLVGVGIVVLLNWPEKEAPVKALEPAPAAVKAPEKVEAPSAPKPVEAVAAAPEPPKVAPTPEPAKIEVPVVTPEPPKAAEPIDVMKALEFREEFKPSGYSVPPEFEKRSNPGYISQDLLDELKKDAKVQALSAYACMFTNGNDTMAAYMVVEFPDSGQATTFRDFILNEKADEIHKINNFIAANHVVIAMGTEASVADELFGKLKKAVNFKE